MGSSKLYKNLENDNELVYLVSENNEDANDIMFKKYANLIDFKARQYLPMVEGKGLDYNDLYQEGMIGLSTAMNKYKENENIRFSTFAIICVERQICSAIRKATRKKHTLLNDSYSLDFTIDDTEGGLTQLADIIPSENEDLLDQVVNMEQQEVFVNKLNGALTDYEKMVYELKMGGFTYDEMSSMLGKSYKSIESALFRVRTKIKHIMKEINWRFK